MFSPRELRSEATQSSGSMNPHGTRTKRVQALTGSHVTHSVCHRLWTRHGSTPWVGVKAAKAAGKHPYPSRTRKLSPPAFRRVLECASLWENCLAEARGQVRGEDPDSEPRRVRPGGSGNGSVDPHNWWFAAYHSYFIHHTEERPHWPLAPSPRPVTTLVGFSSFRPRSVVALLSFRAWVRPAGDRAGRGGAATAFGVCGSPGCARSGATCTATLKRISTLGSGAGHGGRVWLTRLPAEQLHPGSNPGRGLPVRALSARTGHHPWI